MLLHLLGAAGVTNILVRGGVFAWLRRVWGLRLLLKCAMCTGWWVGVVLGLVHVREFGSIASQIVEIVIVGGAVSALATLLDFTLAWLDSQTVGGK